MLDSALREQLQYGEQMGQHEDSKSLSNLRSAHRRNLESFSPLERNRRSFVAIGFRNVNRWMTVDPQVAAGVESTLQAQVTLAWTAFEILSADLWIAAVNERPNPLAVRFAKSPQPKGQDKGISITALSEYGSHSFDLSKQMGTVLVDHEKVDFNSCRHENRLRKGIWRITTIVRFS